MICKPGFEDPAVKATFDAFPGPARMGLLQLRELIYRTADDTSGVGRIEETLKWGQPAYLTPETRSGSTIRLGVPKTGSFALYTHCQTSLISDFRTLFPDDFTFEGNRAIHFTSSTPLPLEPLRLLIGSALTYHLNKRSVIR